MAEIGRYFLALWPNQLLRERLQTIANNSLLSCGGRVVRVENLHLTLRYLGQLTAEQCECVEAQVDGLTKVSFDLSLDRLGFWSKPKVLWLAPSQVPGELESMVATIEEALFSSCALDKEKRPYRPHVTLRRKVTTPPGMEVVPPLQWRAREMVLAESVGTLDGVRYQVRRSWALL